MNGPLSCVRGSTTLEFGIIGPMYVLMVLFTIQVGVGLLNQQMIAYGATLAARQVEVGSLSGVRLAPSDSGTITFASQFQAKSFKNAVCANAIIFSSSCSANLQVYAMSSSDISALQPSAITIDGDGDGNLASTSFDAGGPGSYVIIQTLYRSQIVSPLLRSLFGRSTLGPQSVSVFQNEPF